MERKYRVLSVVGVVALALIVAACNKTGTATGTPDAGTQKVVPCTLDSALLASSTVPEGGEFAIHTTFTETWSVQNSGTCPWPADTQLVYVSGSAMGSSRELPVAPLAAGASTKITMTFKAPGKYGDYNADWQLRAPDGTLFGARLSVSIAIPTPTYIPQAESEGTPVNTPMPTHEQGSYGLGDEGPTVVAIQYLLRAEGYTLETDGVFGPATETAVTRFQAAQGLAADGIVNNETWTALVQRHELQKGDQGDAVKAVQYLLSHAYGYDLLVDGDFGPDTRAAVIDFQSSHVLWFVDGIVGESTWAALIAGD